MQVVYNPWLVMLSVVMAIQGAYVGFSLAMQIGGAAGMRRRLLLAGAAFSLAVAIWTMHFVGMLAARLPFPVDYLVFPTLLSFLVCVIVVGIAVFAISAEFVTPLRLTLSAALMGIGIFSMHYIGMFALHASAIMIYAPLYVIASLVIAIVASALALWLASEQTVRLPLILSSVAFGIAVSGMHYTAMAGLSLYPYATTEAGAPMLSTDLLAIVVAVVAFCLSGIFLLFLVPDQASPGGVLELAGAAAVPGSIVGGVVPADAELGRGTYAPLGGPAGRGRRLPDICPSDMKAPPALSRSRTWSPSTPTPITRPSSTGTPNCSARSPSANSNCGSTKSRFIRVHRSHIINIERVIRHQRAGDSELVEMAATERYTVPVSRSRVGMIKARIGGKIGAASD